MELDRSWKLLLSPYLCFINIKSGNHIEAIQFIILHYLFDHIYEGMAYHYYLPSKYGKMYVSLSNYIFIAIILYYLWTNYVQNRSDSTKWIIITTFFVIGFVYRFYLLDQYKLHERIGYDSTVQENNIKSHLQMTKFFDYGTLVILMIIYFYLLINFQT